MYCAFSNANCLYTVDPTYNGRRYNERLIITNKDGATISLYSMAMVIPLKYNEQVWPHHSVIANDEAPENSLPQPKTHDSRKHR